MKKKISYALSGDEICKALNDRTNIMTFREIMKCKNINQVLGPYRACVILYEHKQAFGHWCAVFEVNHDKIEFFDPYSGMIDIDQNKNLDPVFRKKNNIYKPHLMKLIYESPYKYIEYNNYPFQEHKRGINTCGRHVIVRLLYRNLQLDDYYKMMKAMGDNFDVLVTKITNKLI